MIRARQVPRVARGVARPVPAPVGGLNARDALAMMPAEDALILDNIFPERSYVELRAGYTAHATGLPGAVESLLVYGGSVPRLFAASGSALYDVTSAGAVGSPAVSGLGNARWQSITFTTSGGTFLVAVNGADGVRTFDGTAWATQTITGVSAASLFCVTSWKKRLWFGQAGTPTVWYLGTTAIAGAATALNLGEVWRLGGQIAGILAPSFESMGSGLDDYIGFVSTNGEVAVYRGTDPASASTFALVGVYRLGAPIGARFFAQSGGDLAMLTVDGVVSLLSSLQLDRSESARVSASDKISTLFAQAVQDYRSNYGWQVMVYPEGRRLIVNVPVSSTTAIQYVMNTLSGAWCRYTAHNAACWATVGGSLYFGAQAGGVVYRANNGRTDAGAAIPYRLKTAFNAFGSADRLKRFTLLRPLVSASSAPDAAFGINVDYGDTPATNIPLTTQGGSVWGTAVWGAATWGGLSVYRPWISVGRLGYVGAIRMEGLASGLAMQISAFDVVFEPASALGL